MAWRLTPRGCAAPCADDAAPCANDAVFRRAREHTCLLSPCFAWLCQENDEAKCAELMATIKKHEAKIAEGQEQRWKIARVVFEQEHSLHMERAKTSLLQVELGEVSLLLQDVEHDPLVEERWKQQQAAAAKKGKKK